MIIDMLNIIYTDFSIIWLAKVVNKYDSKYEQEP